MDRTPGFDSLAPPAYHVPLEYHFMQKRGR